MGGSKSEKRVDREQIEAWLIRAVDLLASEYGWSKQDIYNDVFPDELLLLQKAIKNRRASEDYKQAIITLNPKTKNPKELLNIFKHEIDIEPDVDIQTEKASKDSLKTSLQGAGFGVK